VSRADAMREIADAVRDLVESPLYAYRLENGYQPVIGEGDLHASLMIIGEAPGEQEALSGRPFVGAAGAVLDDLLGTIGLRRDEVFITNVVKDRPPGNRNPRVAEIALYRPYLLRQIEIIQPAVIATLGSFSLAVILDAFRHPEAGRRISALHGRALAAEAPHGPVTIVPLYHPASAFYRRELRAVMEDDLRALREVLRARGDSG
jgi:uracil-DNA glycosylase family 4